MLKKAISVALLSGFIAGLFVTVIQSVLVTPLILEAESYEQSASAFRLPDSGEKPWRLIGHEWKHDEGDDSAEWFPDEGLERTFYTAGSNIVTGVAFALVFLLLLQRLLILFCFHVPFLHLFLLLLLVLICYMS